MAEHRSTRQSVRMGGPVNEELSFDDIASAIHYACHRFSSNPSLQFRIAILPITHKVYVYADRAIQEIAQDDPRLKAVPMFTGSYHQLRLICLAFPPEFFSGV